MKNIELRKFDTLGEVIDFYLEAFDKTLSRESLILPVISKDDDVALATRIDNEASLDDVITIMITVYDILQFMHSGARRNIEDSYFITQRRRIVPSAGINDPSNPRAVIDYLIEKLRNRPELRAWIKVLNSNSNDGFTQSAYQVWWEEGTYTPLEFDDFKSFATTISVLYEAKHFQIN